MSKKGKGPRYSNRGDECLAPGCHRTDVQHVYSTFVELRTYDAPDGPHSEGIMLSFGYCILHMDRPYEYEVWGEEAPEIVEAIRQYKESHQS